MFLLIAIPLYGADLTGRVLSQGGEALVRAQIELIGEDERTLSDQSGFFHLRVSSFPVSLKVTHQGYKSRVVTIQQASETLHVTLQPEPLLTDQITVTAQAPAGRFSPAGSAASSLSPLPDMQVDAVADVVDRIPGVDLNGQGGLFQVYSIRGISGQRVMTTFAGAKLTSERRAGVSASFVDPFLLGGLDVLRGPASSNFGSGALGGVVELRPRRFLEPTLQTGYESQGNQTLLASGWGNDGWSVGMAYRRSSDTRDATERRLNSHFGQFSAVLQRDWSLADRSIELLVLPSWGWDIGKPNTDFPERATEYPTERHLLVSLSSQTDSGWRWRGYLHPHELHTEVQEPNGTSKVFNDTFDLGFALGRTIYGGGNQSFDFGVEYVGRKSVDAREETEEAQETLQTLAGAGEDELGLTGGASFLLNPVILELGGRLSLLRQTNAGNPEELDHGFSGFLGLVVPLDDHWEISASTGTGFRFPTLSERFFTGTTGRGSIVANSDLQAEQSLNFEAGLHFRDEEKFLGVSVFQNRISDYIERIETAPDILTFINLLEGTISGVEWEGAFSPLQDLHLYFRGHLLEGEDSTGRPLSDIPVEKLSLGVNQSLSRFTLGAELEARGTKSQPGSGEKRIESAYPLSTFLRAQISSEATLFFRATNLFDEEYFPTSDRKASPAQGRSLSIGIRWTPER